MHYLTELHDHPLTEFVLDLHGLNHVAIKHQQYLIESQRRIRRRQGIRTGEGFCHRKIAVQESAVSIEYFQRCQVILPMSLPALGVVAIFGFNGIWDQYLLPLVAANRTEDYTITVILRSLRADVEGGTGAVLAGAFLALIPSLSVYLLLQKSRGRGRTAGAIKG